MVGMWYQLVNSRVTASLLHQLLKIGSSLVDSQMLEKINRCVYYSDIEYMFSSTNVQQFIHVVQKISVVV